MGSSGLGTYGATVRSPSGRHLRSVSAQLKRSVTPGRHAASTRHVEKRPRLKMAPDIFLALVRAKKPVDVEAAELMTCVEKPRLDTGKNGAFGHGKSQFPPFFALPIQRAGQPGPRAQNREWPALVKAGTPWSSPARAPEILPPRDLRLDRPLVRLIVLRSSERNHGY